MTDTPITPGYYRHYTGNLYWVVGEAINTTNDAHDERMVVYVKADDRFKTGLVPFVRRKTEFLEVLPWPDGVERPRWIRRRSYLRPRCF